MSDDYDISRRKLLSATGTIGAAAALGGAGSMAFFSDEESYANNRLVAGELDMKVGYSAHYSDWKPSGGTPEGEGVEVRHWNGAPDTTGSSSDLNPGETGLPANDAWLVAVDDPGQFLENTQTSDVGADNPTCDDGNDADDLPQPVIDLTDVKPGDFGEVTFDFALCDNPGFVWVQGGLVDSSENGVNEPEASDEDEDQNEDGSLKSGETAPAKVELVDAIQVAVWVDDGNNYQNGEEELFFTGSLRDVIVGDLGEATPPGVPLPGDTPPEEGGGTGDLNCFSAETEHSVAFAWYLPVDHANEIQSDTATFDLGLYTEQCRHNRAEMGNMGNDGGTCPPCSFDTGSEVDGFTNLLSTGADPSAGFPSIDARVRVDSPQGNAGDLTADNFAICENGCGQTIENVGFESGGTVDIVVVFDDTGSMGEEISTLKSEVSMLTSDIESAGIDARYALVSFKDRVEIDTDFTDASTFQSAVSALSASGGGDTPEDNIDALAVGTGNAAADQGTGASLSSFRSGAQRIVIDITDVGAYDSTTDSRARFTQAEIETFLENGNVTYYAVAPNTVRDPISKQDIANNVDDGTWIDINGADFDVILNDIVGAITDPAYVLSYTTTNPATDGSSRTVDVEITDPDAGTAYEEGSYTAPS
ncbi:MAG: VWA domain-containing protein [Haloarcula sp.]